MTAQEEITACANIQEALVWQQLFMQSALVKNEAN